MSNTKSQPNTGLQFFLFFAVGSINFFIRQITFTILSSFGLDTMLCNFLAFSFSVIGSYVLNGTLIFKKQEGEKRVWWKVFLRLYFVYSLTGLVLSGVLLWLFLDVIRLARFMPGCVDALNLESVMPAIEADLISKGNTTPVYEWIAEPVASVITILILTPLNFVVNKFWAYKAEK